MRWLYKLPLRLRSLFKRSRVEHELSEELRFHLGKLIEQNSAHGMTRKEAHFAALREVGGVEQIKEECRDMRRVNYLEHFLQDVRYGLRVLRRNPGFASAAILTLALGIGATTAIFSIVDNVMLKPLPFPTADRLVRVKSVMAATGHGDVASYPDFLDWRARNHVFAGMAAFRTGDFTLVGPREPLHLQGAVVSAQLLSLLGVKPELGRIFLPNEDNPGTVSGTDPVILSYGLWQREFSADPSVLGRTIQLGDQPFTVVGVMPAGFQYPIQADPIELWTTIAADARGAYAMTTQRGAHYLDVAALLKPGVEIAQAQAEMATIGSVVSKQHPENKPRTAQVVPEIQGAIGPLRTPLLILLGAVGCVLLIVCVNVANLLLARATGRHKEMALRAALGASRRRATRQLLTESVALGLLGGGLGLALAIASLRALVRFIPAEVPRLDAIGLDFRLLSFTFLVSLVAGILFGLAPALRDSKIGLTESLNESGRGAGGGGREHSRLRDALVVSEVALAIVLLLGAGLLIQSFYNLTRVNPGFNPDHVLTFQVDSPAGKQGTQIPAFFRDVVGSMRALPSVVSASAVASLPLTGDNISSSFEVDGEPMPMGSRPGADFNAVEPNYFRTLGIALIAGRDFTERDNLKSPPVVIINRTLAQRFFPNRDPIGKRVRPGIGNGYGPGEFPMREVIGVIEDVKQSGLGEAASAEIYAPQAQSPFGTMSLVIRTANPPRTIVEAARRRVLALDKNTPIYHVETLDQYFAQSVEEPRFITLLLGGFAGLALVLACLGIYGVISFTVVQRTREIGIRLAVGAQKGDVLWMVIREGLSPALAGVAIGIISAFRLTRLLSSLLYGIRPADPVTYAVVALTLTGVALLACYIPARRATKVDPIVALRYE